jgi:UDP-galactose transporter B1
MSKVKYSYQTEMRLLLYITGLYITFIYWGYLQEKLTSSTYQGKNGTLLKWDYPFSLNLLMAVFATMSAHVTEIVFNDKNQRDVVSFKEYWRAGLTSTIASPVGYASLRYISFPMMVLTKSSKPIPVMIVGILLYSRKFPIYKYVSVLLICGGIALFSSGKRASTSSNNKSPDLLIGVILVVINLILDGYTNNEQDAIFSKHKSSPLQMMKWTNAWQVIFILIYLNFTWIIYGTKSELPQAANIMLQSSTACQEICLFCLCACAGQMLIFSVMKEFGSLVWITISITRKLATILLSIFMFQHEMKWFQWCGVIFVFVGLTVESIMAYTMEREKSD